MNSFRIRCTCNANGCSVCSAPMSGLETESEQRGCVSSKVNSLLGETKLSSLCWYSRQWFLTKEQAQEKIARFKMKYWFLYNWWLTLLVDGPWCFSLLPHLYKRGSKTARRIDLGCRLAVIWCCSSEWVEIYAPPLHLHQLVLRLYAYCRCHLLSINWYDIVEEGCKTFLEMYKSP